MLVVEKNPQQRREFGMAEKRVRQTGKHFLDFSKHSSPDNLRMV